MSQPVAELVPTTEDLYLFGRGEWFRSYEKLGAHPAALDGVEGYHFAVWAPDVESVSVMGDFNGWDPDACALTRTFMGGIWHGFVPLAKDGELYKYQIRTRAGDILYKADPYAFSADVQPENASRTCDVGLYAWHDEEWVCSRSATDHAHRPLNVLEVHLGSWKRHVCEDGSEGFLTYEELATQLPEYASRMGYTHVELMPVMEHPFDGSWGYQVSNPFAPTARFGEPRGLKRLVDACHQAGVGVILDWVPSGFTRNEPGLVHFNGTRLFERAGQTIWGTLGFNYERDEVRSYLVSNLLYWIGEYHADGIRVDGVTPMIYLNYGVPEWEPHRFAEDGTEHDYAAIGFIRRCCEVVDAYHPDVMMIAEETSAWPDFTKPVSAGGMGFDYKWDRGWAEDALAYVQTDFEGRPYQHERLVRSLGYAFAERFVRALPHDEVTAGKGSLLSRQPGDEWRRMAGMRALALWQATVPGAKLTFMGNEIAREAEWDPWGSVGYDEVESRWASSTFQHFVAMLNAFYRSHGELWEIDADEASFEWIDAENARQGVVSFCRRGTAPGSILLVAINFQPEAYERYRFGVPRRGWWREVFNTDDVAFGGSGVTNEGLRIPTESMAFQRRGDSLELRLPPLAGTVLAFDGDF